MKLAPVLHDIGVHTCMHGYYIFVSINVSSFTEANSPVGQVLARPLFLKVKTKFPFYRKQVINKSTRVIFGFSACYIMIQQIEERYNEVENNRLPMHAKIFHAAQDILLCKNEVINRVPK